jgi:hypothetical protein
VFYAPWVLGGTETPRQEVGLAAVSSSCLGYGDGSPGFFLWSSNSVMEKGVFSGWSACGFVLQLQIYQAF